MPRAGAVMQDWSAASVAFMQDAASYTHFFAELTARLLPWLPTEGHVCDAGCGTGGLALELSRRCREVTAVDLAPTPIAALRARPLPENLHVCCADIFTMTAQYDAMVFCYFGRMREILKIVARQCTGRVLVVKRNCLEHRFSVGRIARRGHSGDETHALLAELDIPYHSEALRLEFGQPFRSLEAAEAFFALYDASGEPITSAELLSRLVKTGDATFPYYLPMCRDMELFVFDAADIPGGFGA